MTAPLLGRDGRAPARTPTARVALRGVTHGYGTQLVLDAVDLELGPGRVTALTGPNGAGKTTVARLLLALERPDDGEVTGTAGLRRTAVFQEDRLCLQRSAVANVRLVLPRRTPASVALEDLRRIGLSDEALRKPVRELSGGQRRRVAIVRALAGPADLTVLDEPFTGLDVGVRPVVLEYVRERCVGRTTLLITHDTADAAFFDAPVIRLPGAAPGRLVT